MSKHEYKDDYTTLSMDIARLAIDHMVFKDTFLDITKLDVALALLEPKSSFMNSREYKLLHALHCVKWTDMPAQVYNSIPMLINRCANCDLVLYRKSPTLVVVDEDKGSTL